MTRSQRIRLVVAIAIAILSLFVALVGDPLITASLRRTYEFGDSAQDLAGALSSAMRAAEVGRKISLGAFTVAGICCVYVFVALAAWFIGPRERRSDDTR